MPVGIRRAFQSYPSTNSCHRIFAPSCSLPNRPARVNLCHDSFRKRNGVSHGGLRRRRMPAVPARQIPRCEDAGSDQEHALSAFIHGIQCSAFAFCSPSLDLPCLQQFRDSHSGSACLPSAALNEELEYLYYDGVNRDSACFSMPFAPSAVGVNQVQRTEVDL